MELPIEITIKKDTAARSAAATAALARICSCISLSEAVRLRGPDHRNDAINLKAKHIATGCRGDMTIAQLWRKAWYLFATRNSRHTDPDMRQNREGWAIVYTRAAMKAEKARP